MGKAVADLAVDLEFYIWIVDDRAELGEVSGAQKVRDVVHRLGGQLGKHVRRDGE